MKRKALILAVVIAVSAVCAASHASLLKLISVRQLAAESDVSALCVVLSKTVKMNDKTPYTYTEVETLEVYKGASVKGDLLTVRQRGGQAGQFYVKTIGDAELVEGSKYVLFMTKSGPEYVLSGMAQAAFKVYKTADGAEMIDNKDETPRLDEATGKIVATPMMQPKPLTQFVKELKLIISELKKK